MSDRDVTTDQPVRRFSRTRIGLLVAVCGAHLPLLMTHLSNLWQRPHYRMLPLLLAVAATLLWRRCPRSADVPYVQSPRMERFLIAVSVLMLGVAVLLNSPLLGAVSAVFATAFILIHHHGVRALAPCIGAWMLLWLLVPPPLGYDLALIANMQSWTSARASGILDVLGVNHLMTGNVLNLPGTTFFVDEACSGVHSLFALLGFTAVFVVTTSRGLRRSLLLLASTVPWALFLNLLRIVAIALCYSRWQIDLSTGWPHELLGFVTFVIALLLTLSTDQLLEGLGNWSWMGQMAVRGWFSRRSRRYRTYAQRFRTLQLAREQDAANLRSKPAPGIGWIATCAYGMLLTTQVAGATLIPSDEFSWEALASTSEEALPAKLGAFHQQRFESVDRDWSSDLGRSSRIWEYVHADLRCVVSADFAFYGWHELTRCYEGTGWRLERRTNSTDADGARSCVEATFTNEQGEHAFLVFGLINRQGALLAPPSGQGVKRFLDRVRPQQTIQVQAFCSRERPLTAVEEAEVRQIFWHAVRSLKPIVCH